MNLPTEPPQLTWKEVHAKELAQHHVGRLARVSWNNGHTVTGRLAILRFAHRTDQYVGGTSSLGDRTCHVTLEVGTEDVELQIPLMGEVEILS